LNAEDLKSIERIEAALDSYLPVKRPEILWEAMRYGVFAGGKRLRPRLLLAACVGLGGGEVGGARNTETF